MQLSPKAIRFIIEALEHYQTYHEEQLRDENLTEEETGLFAIIEADSKSFHTRLEGAFGGCVHFVDRTPYAGSA